MCEGQMGENQMGKEQLDQRLVGWGIDWGELDG